MNIRWRPSVTVAAVIEQAGRFLLVEEHTAEGLRLNNPAGHLDPGESPLQACIRETLEETAYQFSPQALVGVYLARFQRPQAGAAASAIEDVTYLRFAYCGTLGAWDAQRTLDTPIVRTLWLTADEIRNSAGRLRSPLVLQCMEDYLAGQRFGLEVVHTHPSVQALQPPN
jgi:8-oxo-dGTP pyrophosphatase MutT (NUDIX family)